MIIMFISDECMRAIRKPRAWKSIYSDSLTRLSRISDSTCRFIYRYLVHIIIIMMTTTSFFSFIEKSCESFVTRNRDQRFHATVLSRCLDDRGER